MKPCLLIAALLPILFVSCGQKDSGASASSSASSADTSLTDEEAPGLTGTFTVAGDGGSSHTGKVSTQKFPATGQFSVVCQDDAFGFVQITFHNEADARKAQTVKLTDMSYTKANDPGTAHISLSPFAGGETGSTDSTTATATITIVGSHATITFENVELSTKTSDLKKVLSGKVAY